MRRFSFDSVIKLTGFELRNSRRHIFGWMFALFAIGVLYMILFPSVQDMAKMKIDAMPKEMLQLFDMDNIADMSNYSVYFGIVFNLFIIAISIFAATFSANLIYREEKAKTVEFLYALETSRTEIYVAKLLTALIGCVSVLLSLMVATLICGAINGGKTFVASEIVQIVAVTGLNAFFFMALALFLAGLTTRIGVATVGSLAVVVCYMLGYLSKLLETKARWLEAFGPFELFAPTKALAFSDKTALAFGIYLALGVALAVFGALAYNRRDFNI